MFRALIRKEWRQLRAPRLGGLAIGLAMPPVLLLAATGARQGWLPFSSLAESSTREILVDGIPVLAAMFVWPLLTLMYSAHAFAADRAEGTAAFVLERPVPRSRVWAARALAALGTSVVVLTAQWLFWLAIVRIAGAESAGAGSVLLETSANGVWQGLGSAFVAGVALSLVAYLAGMAAGSIVRSPLQGILLGIALALVPAGVAGFLVAAFPAVRIGLVHLGAVFSGLIVVSYPVASYVADCRGEPAGRGRARRSGFVFATAAAAVPALLFAAAPATMRLDARWGLGRTVVVAAPAGGVAVVANEAQGAGWLVDTRHARVLRFLPPRIHGIAWSPDSTRVALVHSAGILGAEGAPRIDVLDVRGEPSRPTIECEECRGPGWPSRGVRWIGEVLAIRAERGLVLLSVESGTRRVVEIGRSLHRWALVGPTDDDRLFVFLADPAGEDGTLREVHIERGVLGSAIPIAGSGGLSWFARRALSPSGRYWIRTDHRSWSGAVIDLATGAEYPFYGQALWIADDELVTVLRESEGAELRVGRPGARSTLIRAWGHGVRVERSPDGRRLLVQEFRNPHGAAENWLYDFEFDRWTPVTEPPDSGYLVWSGPDALAVAESGQLVFLGIDRRDWGFAIGRP